MTPKDNGAAGDGPAVGELANSSSWADDTANHSNAQDHFDCIPLELRTYRSWCVWRWEHVKNQARQTKPPYSPLTNRHASSNDPNTWCDYKTCVDAVRAQVGWHGIGFVLSEQDPYCFIDFDIPKDRDGNRLDRPDIFARQLEWMRRLASYTEISPGGGIHVIVKGSVPQGRKRDFIEVYSTGRFITMTGNVWTPQ